MSGRILPLRPRTLRRLLLAAAAAAVLAGAGVGYATDAHADAGAEYAATHAAAVCLTLDQFPSFAGIEGIAQAIVNDDGYMSFFDAGRAIRVSVDYVCPEHTNLLDAYAAVYAPKGQAL